MAVLSVFSGDDTDYEVTALTETGQVYTGFVDADVPSAEVSKGQGQSVLFTPTCSWIMSGMGTILVQFTGGETVALDPERYLVRVMVTRNSDSRVIPVYQSFLDVQASPGALETLPTYCTYEDLLDYAPWLAKEQTQTDVAGFENYRNLAREWLDSLLQAKWLASGYTSFGNLLIFYQPYSYGAESTWLQQQLDANKLMVLPHVVELTARKSIQLICESSLAPTKAMDTYLQYAMFQKGEVDRLSKTLVGQIDVNGDGYPEIAIPCSISTLAY